MSCYTRANLIHFSDINECKTTELNQCKCAHEDLNCVEGCQNVPGSYICSCRPGFQMMFDDKICVGKRS